MSKLVDRLKFDPTARGSYRLLLNLSKLSDAGEQERVIAEILRVCGAMSEQEIEQVLNEMSIQDARDIVSWIAERVREVSSAPLGDDHLS